MRAARAFAALALAASLAAPARSLAQAPGGAAPSRVRDTLSGEARDAFDRGGTLFARGRYAEARSEFERAFELGGDARVLYNVAVCEKELGRYARAAARLRESLATTVPLPPDYVERARAALELLAPYVGSLSVEASEPGATVFVDSEEVGVSPLRGPLEVDVGRHVVAATREGFYDVSQGVDVPREGRVVRLTLSPRPAPAPPAAPARPPATGLLQITTGDPRAVIYVDGRPQGMGEHAARLEPGSHRVRVVGEGGELYAAEVLVREGETRTVSIQPARRGEVPTWLWVAGGVVLAGAGTATVLLLTRRVEYQGRDGAGSGGPLGTAVASQPTWSF
ncbi:MAG TPA: PEGA domain-containing protein [Polyangiaceae bacterium]|nr:PEGA domain-containing protein [Polyangiaceae bacterium]